MLRIPRLTFVPSEYTNDLDPIGNTTPVPDTVLTVIVYSADVPLVVASSNIIILSEPSGIVTLLFAPNVPVNLMVYSQFMIDLIVNSMVHG